MLYAIGIYEEVFDDEAYKNDRKDFEEFKKVVKPFFEKPNEQGVLNIIYSYKTEKLILKRTKTAQQYLTNFFQINQLENADKILLTTEFFSTMSPGKIYLVKKAEEYNYFRRLSFKTGVIAIASRKALDESELVYLFTNIAHTIIRPDVVKITIKKILENPLGYTGTDILIQATKDKTKEVIEIMHKNIDKVIERGEKLEQLEDKASQLNVVSLKFENSAKKLNRTCCW